MIQTILGNEVFIQVLGRQISVRSHKELHQVRDWYTSHRKLHLVYLLYYSLDRCSYWSNRRQTIVLITQQSCQRIHIYLEWTGVLWSDQCLLQRNSPNLGEGRQKLLSSAKCECMKLISHSIEIWSFSEPSEDLGIRYWVDTEQQLFLLGAELAF